MGWNVDAAERPSRHPNPADNLWRSRPSIELRRTSRMSVCSRRAGKLDFTGLRVGRDDR
jgi:hypothetical protein